MKEELRTVTQQVWYCLSLYPETRNSDRELIRILFEEFYDVGLEPFYKVLDRTDLPSFESIRRTRQKIQAGDEDLRAVPEVEAARIERQEDYIAFARGETI